MAPQSVVVVLSESPSLPPSLRLPLSFGFPFSIMEIFENNNNNNSM